MNDYDAIKLTIDVCERADLLDLIVDLIETFHTSSVLPDNVLGNELLCYGYNKAKQFKLSVKYGEMALSQSTDINQSISIMSNLAKVYMSANMPIKSLETYEYLIQNYGVERNTLDYSAALFANNKKQQSFEILSQLENESWKYDQILSDSISFNMGIHYIRNGDFKSGMDHLHIGRNLKIFGSYASLSDLKEWNGKAKPNAHILMVSEGGIGDEIINVRFVHKLINLGFKCTLMTAHPTANIYDHLPFERIITKAQYKASDYDFWTPMMSLPKTLNLDFQDLYDGPYLTCKNDYHNKFENLVTGSFKVGLRWAGNPRYDHELHRSLNLSSLLNSCDTEWAYYSLQRDIGLDQLENHNNVCDLSQELNTLDDLIGVIGNLDLVITSCTSVAHISAALGKTTIVLVPIMEYYIWAEGKEHSSWYGDNIYIIRQQSPESWTEAYLELTNLLKRIK